jgi:hypothetical protein
MRLRFKVFLPFIALGGAAQADIPAKSYWMPGKAEIAPLAREMARRLPADLSHYRSYYAGVVIDAVTVHFPSLIPTPGSDHDERELKAVFVPLARGEKSSVEIVGDGKLPVLKGEGCMIGPWPSADNLYCNPPNPPRSEWPPK